MENNFFPTKKAHLVRLFLFVAGCTAVSAGVAQKVDKYYTASSQQDGVLYFINPRVELKNKSANSLFEYQINAANSRDSAIVNFSVIDNDVLQIDSLTFIGTSKISAPASKLFIDPAKNLWHNRYTATFAFDELQKCFNAESNLAYQVKTRQTTIDFIPPERTGKKTSAILQRIFTIISVNR